jgi:quinohemoprotein ethanol dehydrogenase
MMKLGLTKRAVVVAALALVVVPVASQAQGTSPIGVTTPVGNEWLTNGGNLGNQRYSALEQISTSNVKNLKAAWVAHTGSALDTKYSFEATPIVQSGVMYVASGNDDVLAFDARTGQELWEYRSGLDQNITTVCCGWDNRGVALGGGLVFAGRLDGSVMAIDQKSGRMEWQTQVARWQDGYTITSAPLYYNGVIYTGISGGERGVRGKLTALDASTGQELWHFWTVPGPGDFGGETWPAGTDAYQHGGATIWGTPAIDPELGLLYFSTGNAGPDYDGSVRPGDNLFSASIVALRLDGSYAWHFQEVHHDLWDYDAPSPVVLFDTTINGQSRKGLAQASKTGWIYLLDRANGKPLVGIEERPVQQEPENATAATQPFPAGDALIPQCAEQIPGWISACIFDAYGTQVPKLFAPKNGGGVDWTPMTFDPQTNALYVTASIAPAAALQGHQAYDTPGMDYHAGGVTGPVLGAHRSSTFSAIDARTNKLIWQKPMPYVMYGGGLIATAGGLLFSGEPDGNFSAYDAKTGDRLWQWQTGAGVDAPPMTYMLDGVQYVTVASGGLSIGGDAHGDMLWTFALQGNDRIQPFPAPKPPATVTGFTGAITPANKVSMVDFAFTPTRTQVKAGTAVTFSNTGSLAHTATSLDNEGFDTGLLEPGASSTVTFDQPGTYTYVCTPHPFMAAQLIVTE